MPQENAPGSTEAKSNGCTCPPDENHMGTGAHIASAQEGKRYFVIEADCPMHGLD